MRNIEKQLHVRLPIGVYRKLKIKCASELISMQDCVSSLINISLDHYLLESQSTKDEPHTRYKDHESYALKLLKHFPLFYDVNIHDLVKLADASVVLHFNKGETIIREGDMPNLYYIIEKGSLRVSRISKSGKEFTIVIRYRGETFGQPSVIKGEPHIASSITLEDTSVLAIKRKDFLAFMVRNPIVVSRIIHSEMERTCLLYERIMDMISDSAPQRVTKTLLLLCSGYGDTLCFTHQDLATLSWTTIETVARAITRLKNAGVITSARGKIIVKDREKLRIHGLQ